MTKTKKAVVKTAKVYYDILGHTHFSREDAIDSNIAHKKNFILNRMIDFMADAFCQEGAIFAGKSKYSTTLSIDDVVRAVLATSLKTLDSEIEDIKKIAEMEYNKDYPNTPLK